MSQKFFQYFGNVRHNSTVPVSKIGESKVFAVFWLCETQFNSSRCFWLGHDGNEQQWTVRRRGHLIFSECSVAWIHCYRPAWLCFIIEFVAAQVKFLESSGYCTLIDCIFTFCAVNVFPLLLQHNNQVWTCKAKVPKLDYILYSSVWLSNYTQSEVMSNELVQPLLLYSQPQQVPFMAWTTWVTWCTHWKLASTKILQNFWHTQVKP